MFGLLPSQNLLAVKAVSTVKAQIEAVVVETHSLAACRYLGAAVGVLKTVVGVVVAVSSVALLDFGEPTQSAVAVAFVASFVVSFVAVAVAVVESFVASFVVVAVAAVESFVAGVEMPEQEPVPSLEVLLFLVMPLQERLLYRLHLRAAVAAAAAAVVAILLQVELQYQLPELTVVVLFLQ